MPTYAHMQAADDPGAFPSNSTGPGREAPLFSGGTGQPSEPSERPEPLGAQIAVLD